MASPQKPDRRERFREEPKRPAAKKQAAQPKTRKDQA